jgi:hypothetical protein
MRVLLVAVPFGLLLIGCAQVPKPSTYALSYQHKMQAAHHWDVLANEVAQRVVAEQGNLGKVGVYVPPGKGVFGTAYSSLVMSALANAGVTIAPTPEGAAVLGVEVQLIQYRAKWPHRANRAQPGFWTAATTIARFAGDMTWNMLIPGGVALDLLDGSKTTLTKHEVVVTTSLQKDGQYLMRQSNIYYINDADRGQYAQSVAGVPKSLQVVAQ